MPLSYDGIDRMRRELEEMIGAGGGGPPAYDDIEDVPANSLLGNNTGAPANALALSAAQARSLLGLGTAALAATGDFQPVDSDLTAIAALSTTSFGRAFLALADAAAGRSHLGLGTAALSSSGDFQPVDADLTAIAALTTTSFGRGFLDRADAAGGRSYLGLGTAALSASGDFQPADSDLTAIAALTTTAYGRGLLELANAAALTAAINNATTSLAGHMSAADKAKLDNYLAPVQMSADAGSRGPAIADYFASTISLEASSTYAVECHAHFLKSTAGTVTWTWLCSSAPVMMTSRCEGTPITGYSGATITGASVFLQATSKAVAAMAHAASGSLTNGNDHSFVFWLHIRTNAATTLQLRSTESAGTITPRAGSYMRAIKII